MGVTRLVPGRCRCLNGIGDCMGTVKAIATEINQIICQFFGGFAVNAASYQTGNIFSSIAIDQPVIVDFDFIFKLFQVVILQAFYPVILGITSIRFTTIRLSIQTSSAYIFIPMGCRTLLVELLLTYRSSTTLYGASVYWLPRYCLSSSE